MGLTKKNKNMKKEQLLHVVNMIPLTAETQKWVISLDNDDGTLFYSPKRIPDNAELHQITDEYAIYTDKEIKQPFGVMVECYNVNFIKHHKIFQNLTKKVLTAGGKEKKSHKENEFMFKALLEKTLIKGALTDFIPA